MDSAKMKVEASKRRRGGLVLSSVALAVGVVLWAETVEESQALECRSQ